MKTKDKLWTNSYLIVEFINLNIKYFGGELPTPRRIAFVHLNGLGHTFRFRTPGKRRSKNDDFGIHISNKLRWSRRMWYSTLIHEMVHLEQGLKYSCGIRGKHFNNRMRQLANMGAFDGIR